MLLPRVSSATLKYSAAANMEDYFRELSNNLFRFLTGEEILLLNYQGETSDFVRLNNNRIRQAGQVRNQTMDVALIARRRESTSTFTLSGNQQDDLRRAEGQVARLREKLPLLPEDPYLNFSATICNTARRGENTLPSASDAVEALVHSASGLDLVGLWASGEMCRGFANSLGQFNWHSTYSFNLDWSLYRDTDKAVKQDYAGFHWDEATLSDKLASGRETLDILKRAPKRLDPGRYRVFLAPRALYELMQIVSWGAFSIKSHRTAQTPLLRMLREDARLHPAVNIRENHASGLTPCFTPTGFIKPDSVELIRAGAYGDCLASARSAKEYSVPVNCGTEHPNSLEVAPGELNQQDALAMLDTGLLVSNLWYCNYSDRNQCRITGMTRFASMWVENGKAVSPVKVMRFDESLYHILGDCLEGLTREREHIIDSSSYDWRSDVSAWLPGALVDGFTFTF